MRGRGARRTTRALGVLVAALLLTTACKDTATSTKDPAGAKAPCVDHPSDLPRPPSGALPCDLLPPDFEKK